MSNTTTINTVVDVKKMREENTNRYDNPSLRFQIPGMTVILELVNIPEDRSKEVTQLEKEKCELQDKVFTFDYEKENLERKVTEAEEKLTSLKSLITADVLKPILKRDYAAQGRTIEAIKLVREFTTMSLLEAKQFVSAVFTETPAYTAPAENQAAFAHDC